MGGAIKMNAGSFDQSISDTVIGMDVLTARGEIIEKAVKFEDFRVPNLTGRPAGVRHHRQIPS